MAYYSLPRLERIGASMTWDAGILHQNERWLATKVFFAYKYFIPLFFKYYTAIFVSRWLYNYESQSILQKNKLTKPFFRTRTKWWSKKKKKLKKRDFMRKHLIRRIIGYYIYLKNNIYTTLILYVSNDTYNRHYLKLF